MSHGATYLTEEQRRGARKVSDVQPNDPCNGELLNIDNRDLWLIVTPLEAPFVSLYGAIGTYLPCTSDNLRMYIKTHSVPISINGLRLIAEQACAYLTIPLPDWPSDAQSLPQLSRECPCGITRADCDYHKP
jgi:hypothetical protein